MNRERAYEQEDEFGKLLMDTFKGAYPDGFKKGTVVCDPQKMVEFKRLEQILCDVVKDTGAVMSTDVLQESETSAYICISGKSIQMNSTEMFLRAVEICPVVEILTKAKDGGVVEITFAVNGFAKRI